MSHFIFYLFYFCFYVFFFFFFFVCRYHVIANPLERKITMPKAVFIVILVWCYTIPWALFPYLRVWGRFVPGKYSSNFITHFRFFSFLFAKITATAKKKTHKQSHCFYIPTKFYYSQRDSWHRAHLITWPIRLTIDFLSVLYSHSAIVFRCYWSFTIMDKLLSTFSAMRKRYERKPKKWMSNRCGQIKKVPVIQRPKCALLKQRSQFAFYLLHVRKGPPSDMNKYSRKEFAPENADVYIVFCWFFFLLSIVLICLFVCLYVTKSSMFPL